MEMDIRSMAEVRFWRTRSSQAKIAAETLTSTRKRYGCWRTRATRKVRESECFRRSRLKLFRSLARAMECTQIK